MPATADTAVAVPNGTYPHSLSATKRNGITEVVEVKVDIIDIRRAAVEISLKDDVLDQFHRKDGPRALPTLLLYDEKGLQLFEHITYLDEYYLTNNEIALLKARSAEMAANIPSGSMVIELGSGNLRKVNLLLQALEDAEKKVDYYALDLSRKELERTLAQLPGYRHVACHGLHGTYEDGREWLKKGFNATRAKCILSLGSSIGNFSRSEAVEFLRGFADILRDGDTMLIGLDGCDDPAKVFHAYNDSEGVTHKFILNGLLNANEILGDDVFKSGDWRVIGEYVHDGEGGRHQAFYAPVRDTIVMGDLIRPHDRIKVEQSLKYSNVEAEKLWAVASLTEIGQWKDRDEYGLHMLRKGKMPFSLISTSYATSALPTYQDWEGLWTAWDTVTRGMLKDDELLNKPIKLRNACIFYLGHIPTFLDIQLCKTSGQSATEPAFYHKIFERGIDPDVDNPEHCHAHSEIPDEWPPLEDILAYQTRVRSNVRELYSDGRAEISRQVGRALWLGFEHEVMHLETLLYMMLHSDKTLPPPNTQIPDWEKLAAVASESRVPNQWFDIPSQDITIGIDESEAATGMDLPFGWDNEKPKRPTKVHSFQAQGRPITNGEYARYMTEEEVTQIPASWIETDKPKTALRNGTHTTNGNHTTNGTLNGVNGHSFAHVTLNGILDLSRYDGMAIRTVYGNVPLKYALDWPVFASYDELSGCAAWMGGRIPTFEEARSIYVYSEAIKKDQAENTLGSTVPAVNAHLSNNGVEESPPTLHVDEVEKETGLNDLFLDLDGANVGFQRWHPVPVTGNGDCLAGQAEMGGVWEWTSTTLAQWDGFEPMPLYPGYTADFFDGKHNIVLGGSWATHPRIAGRKSFVNWYQRNYPYPWCGARLVRDIE